jgi:glutaredoxin
LSSDSQDQNGSSKEEPAEALPDKTSKSGSNIFWGVLIFCMGLFMLLRGGVHEIGEVVITPAELVSLGVNVGPNSRPPVLIFGTEWCPGCKKARRDLSSKAIPFFEADIERSTRAQELFQRIAGGGGIPVIWVNNHVYRGYDSKTVVQAWKQYGQS